MVVTQRHWNDYRVDGPLAATCGGAGGTSLDSGRRRSTRWQRTWRAARPARARFDAIVGANLLPIRDIPDTQSEAGG